MPKIPLYDVLVIGSGSAGFSAVETAVAQGVSVCLIEKGLFGGECPNEACIPSKAVLRSASVYRQMGGVKEFGLDSAGRSFEWKNVMRYRSDVVDHITGGGERGDRYEQILKKWKVDTRFGEARFVDAHMVEVQGELIKAHAIVIATGTVDFIPPIPGIEQIHYWGWREALSSKRQPKSMAIIGAGPVGCEIAMFYASFGTRVVLIDAGATVLTREDIEISERATTVLRDEGVEVVLGAKVAECVNGRVGVTGLKVVVDSTEQMYAVEQVVIATGKRVSVESLHLEETGVILGQKGEIKTTKEQRTNIPHIFAAGDVAGGLQFTHTAHHEGNVAGYNAAQSSQNKKKRIFTDERVVPRVTFLDPEVASVGETQMEVENKFGKALVGRFEVGQLGRASTDHVTRGLIKLVAHPKTRILLGAHLICTHAGELVHEPALAIYLGATIDKLAEMIHAFPTYAEGVKAAAFGAKLE